MSIAKQPLQKSKSRQGRHVRLSNTRNFAAKKKAAMQRDTRCTPYHRWELKLPKYFWGEI